MESVQELRKAALEIFGAALKAADPAEAIRRHVRLEGTLLKAGISTFDLSQVRRMFVVGAGKASAPMGAALEEILHDRILEGLMVTKYGHLGPVRRVRLLEAGHPVPDEAGLQAARAVLDLVERAGEGDLVIVLISGGGSALLPFPVEGVTLEEKQKLTGLLLACGAAIKEINAVRKHLSRIKGGKLAQAAFPAKVLALILSDVVGDPLDAIASGPTAPDLTTFADAFEILKRYRLLEQVPASILQHLQAGLEGKVLETPKADDPLFEGVTNVIVGSNLLALLAAKARAEEFGFRTLILSSSIEGETREVAKVHGAIAREVRRTGHPIPPPACIISGGETTVTLRGTGKGGRNQEFVLAAALEVEGLSRVVVLSCGTDGTDGPTDAAGAVADGETLERAKALRLDPSRFLEENDAYHFFQGLKDLIMTGPTNTNVMDVRLILVGGD
ncbi:MAG: glycerate kinase [candidate division NC10 bacterium]|nr:glycerate kinase [candidate division NC10 bacterium]